MGHAYSLSSGGRMKLLTSALLKQLRTMVSHD
jgi:hypothetical protein